VLALKRHKELPPQIILQTSEFINFINSQLLHKFALMGKESKGLIEKEQQGLVQLLHSYYGLNKQGRAFKLEEISQALGRNDVTQLKRNLEEYIQLYRLDLVAQELGAS
jgi:hypothetical protein